MVVLIPAPDPSTLLPPLLACLPTSFASSKPPPALLSLVSPILSQRLQIHTSSSSSNHDNWIRLLCWNTAKGEKLKDYIENANFEPHPVSGEVEVGDTEPIKYKRFDSETLRAQIPVPDWEMTAIYLWTSSSEGDSSWKLAELLPFDSDMLRDATWSLSPSDANEASRSRLVTEALRAAESGRKLSVPGREEDDYWAQYDTSPGRTPARTPARKESVAPTGANATEDDYYARYGDVQPAMDNHDPDEVYEENGGSNLDENTLGHTLPHVPEETEALQKDAPTYNEHLHIPPEDVSHVSQPVPSSPSSRASSGAIARLEDRAEKFSASEIGIRQHISTSIKSMYRLAKSAGMNRDDFERMVQRELETLSIFDHDD